MASTIRVRLTLWYTAVLLVVLVLFGAWVYSVERYVRLDGLDQELRRAAALVHIAITDELNEGATLADAAAEAYRDFAVPGRALAIHDRAGTRLAGSWAGFTGLPAGSVDDVSATVRNGAEDWRMSVERRRHDGVTYHLVMAEPLAGVHREMALLRRTLLVGVPLVLALAAAGGSWIARRAMRPVSMMVGQAGQITDRTPGVRLRVPRPDDELGLLARAFNELLERLEGALRGQRQFMADASHELRTPVSIVRTAAEVTLGRETRSEREYRDSLGIVGAQSRRLAQMVDGMLTLARADAGGLTAEGADLYLDELAAECVRDVSVLAAERQVEVQVPEAGEIPFHGDERLLRQLFLNLLENGIRHTPAGGRVEVRLAARDGWVELAVADTGGGVPPAERERIFERFVRLDPARTRPGGAGLGLPIARCIAEAHGGTLTLAETGPSGSTFVARLARTHLPH